MSFHTNNRDKAIKIKANQTNERLALKEEKNPNQMEKWKQRKNIK